MVYSVEGISTFRKFGQQQEMSNKLFTTSRGPSIKKRPVSNGSVRSESSDTPFSAILSLTTCHLCKKDMCRPKHLPCIHSFCESCIEVFVNQIKENKISSHISCPVCDMPAATIASASPKEFAENLPTSTLISTVMSRKCASSPSCGRCKSRGRDSKAASWCGYCAQALCEEHSDYHQDLTTTKVQHPVVKLKDMLTTGNFEFVRKCKFHHNEEMTHFCKDEWTPCCPICSKGVHKGCNVVRLQQVATNIKMDPSTSHLRTAVDSLENETNKLFKGRQKNIERINEQLQTEQELLRGFREKINSHLDELEDNLATELEACHTQKRKDLEKEAKTFQTKSNTLNYYKLLLDSIQETSGNYQAVQELATIRAQTKIMENEIKITSARLKWIDLTVTYPYDLVKSITRLGSIQQRVTHLGRVGTPKSTPR